VKNFIVVGLGFGDEGKGAVVDYLSYMNPVDLVVRFNGGAQAAHTVVVPDGKFHTFHQLGSASFNPGVCTLLSKHMLVNPVAFLFEVEAFHLDAKGYSLKNRVFVDDRALLTTPYHVALNRARETARGTAAHGTTGMGISETVMDSIARESAMRVSDLTTHSSAIKKALTDTRDALAVEMRRFGGLEVFDRIDMHAVLDNFAEFESYVTTLSPLESRQLLQSSRGIVFEGAQGVLLDENLGFHPHTTWSQTTAINAIELLTEARMYKNPANELVHIGVMRTYHTRHGPGPFPSEHFPRMFPEYHNGDAGMAGQFRQGWLDMSLFKYAVACAGKRLKLDGLAINHVDYAPNYFYPFNPMLNKAAIPSNNRDQVALCSKAWHRLDPSQVVGVPEDFPNCMARNVGVPVMMIGKGPTRSDKTLRNHLIGL
jgi:adenylosuccinate synthase